MFLKTKKLLVATLLTASATSAFAAGTVSGTDVDSTASLSFTVGGNAATVTSANTYKVDNKVDLSVSTSSLQATTVSPNAAGVVMKFTIQNNGNTVQDFLLSALTTSTTVFVAPNDVTDTDNFSNIHVYADSNDNGTYEPATDTVEYIDELAPDATATAFIVADVPALSNNAIAIYDLQAQVAEGGAAGTQGVAIATDNSNIVDDAATVQIVFADGAGTADIIHDGKFSSADAWKVVTATVTVSKDSIVVSDPVNGTTNPKRIPGAVIRYCYIVSNAVGGAEAAAAIVTDTIDPAILDTTGQTVATYNGVGTCDCSSIDADIAGANGVNGQDPDGQGIVKVDFDTVAGDSTECAYVSATIK